MPCVKETPVLDPTPTKGNDVIVRETTIRRRRPVLFRVLCALAVLPVALWAGIGHLLKHTGEWMIDVTH